MKPNIRSLPVEVWSDVSRHWWFLRFQMVTMVALFGDRRFKQIMEFFLHNNGSIILEPHGFFKWAKVRSRSKSYIGKSILANSTSADANRLET